MGGYLCFEILRLAPERVERLALIGTTANAEEPDVTERRWHMIRKAEQRGFLTMWREFIPRFLHPSLIDNQDVVDTLMKQAYEVGEYSVRQHQIAMMKRTGYLDLLEHITCPTTVMVGEDDILTPVEDNERMAAAIPGAKLVVMPKSGHLLSLERPDQTTEALRTWLNERPLKQAA
jgi:pimeloyl-ACP methyl ester carboxylesterase